MWQGSLLQPEVASSCRKQHGPRSVPPAGALSRTTSGRTGPGSPAPCGQGPSWSHHAACEVSKCCGPCGKRLSLSQADLGFHSTLPFLPGPRGLASSPQASVSSAVKWARRQPPSPGEGSEHECNMPDGNGLSNVIVLSGCSTGPATPNPNAHAGWGIPLHRQMAL